MSGNESGTFVSKAERSLINLLFRRPWLCFTSRVAYMFSRICSSLGHDTQNKQHLHSVKHGQEAKRRHLQLELH